MTICGKKVDADAERLTTNGARVHFGDDEDTACPDCRASTPPYPLEWVRIDEIWHGVAE